MNITELPIDLDAQDGGVGSLLITDAALLVRPRRVPGQYPASVNHDTVHSYRILSLGHEEDAYRWHIVYGGDPQAAHQLLDRVFYAFVDGACFDLWCDARVCYIVDDNTVRVEEYGFSDGNYTMVFNVYCGIAEDQTEEFIAALVAEQTDRFVVVRPEASEYGFSAQGFIVEESDRDDLDDTEQGDWDDREDDIDDKDPLAGDVDPTGGYYEPPMDPFEARHLPAMRLHGDYTG